MKVSRTALRCCSIFMTWLCSPIWLVSEAVTLGVTLSAMAMRVQRPLSARGGHGPQEVDFVSLSQ